MSSTAASNTKSSRKVVGVVPVDTKRNLILLVSSRKHPDQWVLPKGGVEKNETEEEAASRECLEEAGVKGTIESCLGTYSSQKKPEFDKVDKKKKSNRHSETFKFFTFHVSEVLPETEWIESTERKRQWFTFSEASVKVRYSGMQEAIEALSS